MNITSTPFIRNDYWPDYNELNELNGRIDEVENELSLTNINLTDKIENVEGNLNAYISQQNNTVTTNNVVVNNINANYATGDFLNFNNVNLDNVYVENLTVNKPVFDITLNTPHIDNITVTGGNIFNTNIVNCEINTDNIKVNNLNVADGFAEKFTTNELIINKNIEPVTSSAVLGYDVTGKVIPVRATYDVSFPEDANYLYTDHFGTAYAGTAETEVTASDNLITANAVYNEALNITGNIDNLRNDMNNEFNIVNDNFVNIGNNFNDVANNFNIVNNNFADIDNSFNNVNNTANNLLDNVDYLKTALVPLLSLPVANVSGWIDSKSPVNIMGITSFVVAPFVAPVTTGSDVGDGAKLSVSGTTATLALPGFHWTMESMNGTFTGCLNFNQNIVIPDGVTSMEATFTGCLVFNQNIRIPNSVTNMYRAFGGLYIYKDGQGVRHTIGCPNFNQNILIPNSVTNMFQIFQNDDNLNQNILIPNSVTRLSGAFLNCNNLNQPNMYIYSQNITSMGDAFKGCHINNIHIPTSVPKSTSNFMYNCLVNGNTGITFPAANIFNDLPVDIGVWPPEA